MFTSVFLSAVCFVSIIAVLVDPHDVFHLVYAHHFNRIKRHVVSDRMAKVYALARVKPRTLLLGASTIGSFDPKDLERYAPSPVYNLALGGAHVPEMTAYLRYAVSRHNVRTVVVGLDFFGFFPHDARNEVHPAFDPRRLSSGVFFPDYQASLFGLDVFMRSLKTVRDNLGDSSGFQYIDYETGMFVWASPQAIGQQRRDIDEFRLGQLCEVYGPSRRSRVIDNVAHLKELIEVARSLQIDIRVYVGPAHVTSFDVIHDLGLGALYAGWQRAMADVVPYYDFSGPNTINNDPENFVDMLHLKSEGGRLVFARLFGDVSIAIPHDFGVLVTRSNVDAHLRDMESHPLTTSATTPAALCAPRDRK